MSTFVEILEEIAGSPVISIPANELDDLVARFGDRVRHMGRWNVSTDGSLSIPVAVIRDAAEALDNQVLSDALSEIKTESFSKLMESSAAVALIDKIREAYDAHFRRIMDHYQNATNPAEADHLRDDLVREIFGE